MTPGVVTLGEALGLVRTSGPDGFELAREAQLGIGGAEANVAIGLSRLGVDATWLGRVGDDEFGRRIVRDLRAEGVTVVAGRDTDAPTGLMLKDASDPDATSVRFHRSGSAGSRLSTSDLAGVDIAGASWLHVTGIPLALSTSAAEAVLTAVAIARGAGVTVSFDINHRARLWDYAAAVPVYREVISRADVVFGGDDELAAVVGPRASAEELADAIRELGPREAVVKCGARGAGALHEGGWVWRDAIPVSVVDTVGAGDAFVAGYISSRLDGEEVADAVERAVMTGAAACRHPGDWEGALYRHQLRRAQGDPVAR